MDKFIRAERELGTNPFDPANAKPYRNEYGLEPRSPMVKVSSDNGTTLHVEFDMGLIGGFELWLRREGVEAIRDACNAILVHDFTEPSEAPHVGVGPDGADGPAVPQQRAA